MKRYLFCIAIVFICANAAAQKVENLIVITTDGLRWQELFNGMDTALANNRRFNQDDSAYLYQKYGAADLQERRNKLMPFMWSTLAQQGQLYGNRTFGNKVNNANPHWFSYPGYSELFTGFVDEKVNSNNYPPNPHTTVLEFINTQPQYRGKVAAFTAWDAFDRILNEQRAGFPVVAAYDTVAGNNLSSRQKLVNEMLRASYRPWHGSECLDVFTHYAAMEYLKEKRPKVLYVGYGETDEWAHAGEYRFYLDAAHQVDKWIGEIWSFVQSHPAYKNKTALLITTDHGRGDKNKNQWTGHGSSIEGAGETWFALISPNMAASAKGEMKADVQLYQQQLTQTMAALLGLNFTASHPVARAVDEVVQNLPNATK